MSAISTEFPLLTADNFESSLASDDVLALFFNDFLSLPSFSEDVTYNQESGLFELVDGAADRVSARIRAALKHVRSQLLAGDTTVLTRNPPEGNHYTVFFLDREKGIQWIEREKLPLFLKSDCYYEYRLAKFFLQHGPPLSSPRNKSSSGRSTLSASQPHQCSQFTKQNDAAEVLTSHREESKSANQAVIQEEPRPREPCCQTSDPPEQRSQDAVSMVGGLHLLNTEEAVETSAHQKSCTSTGNEKEVQTEWDEKNEASGVENQGNGPDPFSGINFHEFCAALHGKQGGKLLRLWMDTERLKDAQNPERKNRHLVLMTNWYLLSGCSTSLNEGLLSYLGLTTSPCWTEDKLLSVHPYIAKCLLHYWDTYVRLSQNFPELAHDPKVFYNPNTCCTRLPLITRTELVFSRTRSPCSGQMKKLLEALCVESRSGLYFTRFCEESGNQLWVNAVYFWTDLQYYHELFHQDELYPYRAQMEAEHLHFTYISSSARRDIGIDEDLRKEVGNRLMPASEELFGGVEEHVLNVLLEPWTLLVSRDRESFHQVHVQEQVRCINSPEYRELLGLYEESNPKLKEVSQHEAASTRETCSTPSSTPPPDSWSGATSEDLLRSILAQHHQIKNFKSFLQQTDASIHLLCWLDLEEYRRTPHKDIATRQDRSLYIATKYLNQRYFFGPRSPATAEQQNDMLRSAGGHERLKSECLSDPVVVGIQDIIKNHIEDLEETLLPAFLSTTSLTERQEHAAEAVHPKDLWMSSSKEIEQFRRALLNPVTSQQFQYFVSPKGRFLENDVCFWLEVQRYKNIYDSHCEEAIIQKKISVIITCFINSPLQPSLRIDIPPDQAQRILQKGHELGPYIFREAQMSVFDELLKFWPEFQKFTSSVQEEQLLPLLQEKRAQHIARLRRQKRKEEEEEEVRRTAQIGQFQNALLNPVTSQQFQYFVSPKGRFLENDVCFWLEVQRYKDLYDSHCEEAIIQKKISAIITCFINSPLQPSLRIDIPPDQAQRILQKGHELGPYIFREAQMSVFDELLKFWPEFQKFTSSVQEEQLLPLLQEKRAQHIARLRRKEEEEEVRRTAQDELVRRESHFTQVDSEHEEMERKEGGVKKPSTRSRITPTPTQPLLQSYSKYMVALKKEDVLLRKQSQLAASSSTVSEPSSDCSIKPAGADGKQ